MYMLDTNALIMAVRHPNWSISEKIRAHLKVDICLSSIVYAELEYGFRKRDDSGRNRREVSLLLDGVSIVPFDKAAAEHFGDIFADLERRKCRIGDRDTMIAAHARSQGYTVVTHNVREFSRVAGLSYEDWV